MRATFKRNTVLVTLFMSAMMTASLGASCGGGRDAFTGASGEFVPIDAAGDDCGFSCSGDLKTVLRRCAAQGTGEAVETCAPGMGCGGGRCVDACRAAELSKGSTGCAFYAVQPDDQPGNCYAALLANTWDQPATIQGEFEGKPLDLSRSIYDVKKNGDDTTYTPIEGPLLPGQVAVVFLNQRGEGVLPQIPCPEGITTALTTGAFRSGTRRSEAIRLSSSVPISAYAIFPYGGASGHFPTATLLLPVSSWDTAYIAVSPTRFDVPDWEPSAPGSDGVDVVRLVGPRYLQVVASEDDTTVSMRPVVDMGDGDGVTGVAAGHVQSWKLSRGEMLQVVQPDDLTGSTVTSDKPIGLFGGAWCSFVPSTWWACDLMQQQIPPPSQWGNEYAVVPFRPRASLLATDDLRRTRDLVPYSFVGAADETTLSYDPAPPAGAPTTLKAGQTVIFETTSLFSVRSQDTAHPFFVGSYMPGADYRGGHSNFVPGDPEFVNVVPTDQYLDRYIFFTDFTFAQTTLTVIRRKTDKGFSPVVLDCAGEITDFQPLGNNGNYEYAWVLLTSMFRNQKFGDKECTYGRHEISSESPFEVTVWGTDYYASYGYPGGMGLRPISPVKPVIVR